MRRIAVFSDTHDHYPSGLPEMLRSADEIWHLGDVCEPTTLVEFELLGKPLFTVRGNNDWNSSWPLTRQLKREGLVFHLEHIPPRKAPPGVDIVLHGHTHIQEDYRDDSGIRFLNPGCITAPRAKVCSFAWLVVQEGKSMRWNWVNL